MKKLILILTLSSCSTYQGTVIIKNCCPSYLEVEVQHNWFVIPGNALEWFDSVNVMDSVVIDRKTLRITRLIN